MLGYISIAALAFCQNVAFSLVSRSRNRDNMTYHVIAAIASNGVWFLTFRYLVTSDMSFDLFLPYTAGTVSGSVYGVKVSMWIESKLGATSDGHVKKEPPVTVQQVKNLIDKKFDERPALQYARIKVRGCHRDSDGDGDCIAHPNGCPDHLSVFRIVPVA